MIYLVVTIMCYAFVALLKKTRIINEALPAISASIGALLAAAAYCWLPEIVPTSTVGEAVVFGLFCGLAATGSNQVVKQALKYFANKYGVNIGDLHDEQKGE